MKFDVYGRKIEIIRKQEQWVIMILGNDGKKRLADDIIIPSHIQAPELESFLADLYHEWACEGRDRVVKIQ